MQHTVKDRNAECVPAMGSAPNASARTTDKETDMSDTAMRRQRGGVGRLVRRIERERRAWSRRFADEVPTEQAWRAGVAEGLRLAQIAIRKGV
jgi:hypothetical protein